jgi:dTDP-glucose pyrophosphorylase/predicted transcriptional regulator
LKLDKVNIVINKETIESTYVWEKSLLQADTTLLDAIKNLNSSGFQIALVISSDNTFIGTLTDGDIRRGLLRGLDLDSSIKTIIYRDSLVVPPELGKETILQLMQANGMHQLPVVNDKRIAVGLHLWDDLMIPSERSNIMVIMAGGKGTRLRPHTENCPKPLLKVGGKPIMEHIIERAKSQGIHHFVIAVFYLGDMIKEYFGDGSKWNIKIDYLNEESPLGTAGALGLMNSIPEEPFIVTNGDVLTDINYGELLDFHCLHQATATMAVQLHEWQHPFGVVRIDGVDIIGFEEKPISRSHINAGVYILEPLVISTLEIDQHCDMPTLFSRMQENNERTVVYPMHEPWLDVGRPDDLERARIKHSPSK